MVVVRCRSSGAFRKTQAVFSIHIQPLWGRHPWGKEVVSKLSHYCPEDVYPAELRGSMSIEKLQIQYLARSGGALLGFSYFTTINSELGTLNRSP